MDFSNGTAFVQNGILYYSPNCTRPVVIPPQTNHTTSPFNVPCLSASLFRQPIWWSSLWGWVGFIPMAPSFISVPFESFFWMPVIEKRATLDEGIHGTAEKFLILVEDVNSEVVLFYDNFALPQRYTEDEHNVTPTMPVFEPVPPNYYISVMSDCWLHLKTQLPIPFRHLILPKKSPKPTPLLDLQALPLSALHNEEFEAIYAKSIQIFHKIQTQLF